MKLIVSAKTNQVLGLHMCGDDAPEIVQVFVVVVVAAGCSCFLYCSDNDTRVLNLFIYDIA
jgi:pyruvate/2-oxoglutarate dehydrogenase complex dihydrolipoamide dehydrogenase (E3) component